MFGHQNDQSKDTNDNSVEAVQDTVNDQAIADAGQAAGIPDAQALATATDTPAADDQSWQHPGTPIDGAAAAPAVIDDVISPAGGFPKAPSFSSGPNIDDTAAPIAAPGDHIGDFPAPATVPAPAPVPLTAPIADDDTTHELIDIKTHALNELSPLIDQLDQPPEEKFRTLMMLIQASDDQHLVKAAYESAHAIENEKVRARALLDIVNEINYFTQQPEN